MNDKFIILHCSNLLIFMANHICKENSEKIYDEVMT